MNAKVLLTRSAADNARLAVRLGACGIETISVPLLDIEAVEESAAQRNLMLELDRYHAVMVVSPVAARLGLERLDRYWPQAPVGIEWMAVGGTSAAVLEEYGLGVHTPRSGQDSEALLKLPIWADLLQKTDLRVLVWRGNGGRELLADRVREAGGRVDYLELYRRTAPQDLPDALRGAQQQGVQGVVITSGQALAHWHEAAGSSWSQQSRWRCWVPSQRLADQARSLGCDDIIVCNGADDGAVLVAVTAHPPTQ